MKKSIIKKLFIKLSKILGYEIIDQNDFSSPTLQKELNEELSTINEQYASCIMHECIMCNEIIKTLSKIYFA